ncbi:MAG: histidinol-phosphate transaminase [Candidatus Omnitrophota bacterium]|nr:MAG: histidinol-phosphate transaminase [Candidatus Omnitrophota bacterium]
MSIFLKDLKSIKPYTPGKPIEEVQRELGLKQVYKLASNEIPFIPTYLSKEILKELKSINRYPEASCFYLKRALAKQLKVNEDRLVFGNGSDELITLTLRVSIEKGDEVIVAYPTFLIYEIQAKAQGAKVVTAPLKDFRYDLEIMAKKVSKKTKIIFIANPDNPTGTYLTHKELEQFFKRIPKRVLVFLDEAYFDFAPSDYPRSLEFLKNRGNIIIARTFSKAYGLAGVRIGYGITTPQIATALNTVREPFNVNRFAQVCALAALKNKEFLSNVVNFVKKEKNYLYSELEKLNVSFIKSATNFILIDFKQNTTDIYNYFLRKGIIVRELKGWGLNGFFRVTVGRHNENKEFIDCFKVYLRTKFRSRKTRGGRR